MKYNMIPKTFSAFLQLKDGTICQGWSFLNSFISIGEVVFNTGMTGYQEVFTDPSYCDQIILFTYPEIGNTGINIDDMESLQCYAKGVIFKNLCLQPSNWRSELSLAKYLVEQKIPHIFGLDTRYLVKYLRSKGAMLGCITSKQLSNFEFVQYIKKSNLSQATSLIDKVATNISYKWSDKILSKLKYFNKDLIPVKYVHVVVVDFGVKFNILRLLKFYGCCVTVVPAYSTYAYIMSKSPDGILLSNGPGDPSTIINAQETVKKLISTNIPIFGICLGHQLLSLALGAKTTKLKFGHRGLNHPSGLYNRINMTSQNHGFFVKSDLLSNNFIRVVSVNLNDCTIAGIVHKYKPCFSVQYHPEASPGPHDSEYLFSHFIKVIVACKF